MAKKSTLKILSILLENKESLNVFHIEEFEPSLREGIEQFCLINDKQNPNMFLEFLFNPACPEMGKRDKEFTQLLLFGFLSACLKKKSSEVCNLVMDEIDLQILKHQKNERLSNRK